MRKHRNIAEQNMRSWHQDTGRSSSQQRVVDKLPTKLLQHCCRKAGSWGNIAADNSYVASLLWTNDCCYVNAI